MEFVGEIQHKKFSEIIFAVIYAPSFQFGLKLVYLINYWMNLPITKASA